MLSNQPTVNPGKLLGLLLVSMTLSACVSVPDRPESLAEAGYHAVTIHSVQHGYDITSYSVLKAVGENRPENWDWKQVEQQSALLAIGCGGAACWKVSLAGPSSDVRAPRLDCQAVDWGLLFDEIRHAHQQLFSESPIAALRGRYSVFIVPDEVDFDQRRRESDKSSVPLTFAFHGNLSEFQCGGDARRAASDAETIVMTVAYEFQHAVFATTHSRDGFKDAEARLLADEMASTCFQQLVELGIDAKLGKATHIQRIDPELANNMMAMLGDPVGAKNAALLGPIKLGMELSAHLDRVDGRFAGQEDIEISPTDVRAREEIFAFCKARATAGPGTILSEARITPASPHG